MRMNRPASERCFVVRLLSMTSVRPRRVAETKRMLRTHKKPYCSLNPWLTNAVDTVKFNLNADFRCTGIATRLNLELYALRAMVHSSVLCALTYDMTPCDSQSASE